MFPSSYMHYGLVEHFIHLIPDEFIQLTVTSPPYNLNKEYEKKITLEEYLDKMRFIIRELYRVTKDSGSVCWQVGTYIEGSGKFKKVYPLDLLFYPLFVEAGFFLKNRIVWTYGHGLHDTYRFSGRHETILWFVKGDYVFNLDKVRVPAKYSNKRYYKGPHKGELSCNPLGKNPSDVWDITNVKHNHPEKTIHPCQFPSELVNRCVLSMSNEDDWVFDPFAGVGTTLKSALKYGRKALGCEKEVLYVKEFI